MGAVVVCEEPDRGPRMEPQHRRLRSTAHAEIVALREAGATVGNHRLEDCELFATIEPCAMCAGAMVHARIKRLVYGADDPKAGAVHSVMQVAESSATEPQDRGSRRSSGGPQRGNAADVL